MFSKASYLFHLMILLADNAFGIICIKFSSLISPDTYTMISQFYYFTIKCLFSNLKENKLI